MRRRPRVQPVRRLPLGDRERARPEGARGAARGGCGRELRHGAEPARRREGRPAEGEAQGAAQDRAGHAGEARGDGERGPRVEARPLVRRVPITDRARRRLALAAQTRAHRVWRLCAAGKLLACPRRVTRRSSPASRVSITARAPRCCSSARMTCWRPRRSC
eukprot:3041323-Prymnesium_polylepis.1